MKEPDFVSATIHMRDPTQTLKMTTLTKQIFVKITIPFQALGETATSRKAGVRKYNHGEN